MLGYIKQKTQDGGQQTAMILWSIGGEWWQSMWLPDLSASGPRWDVGQHYQW